MKEPLIQINPLDNVAVALWDIAAGERCAVIGLAGEITAAEAIPAGHKLSLSAIAAGENIVKYGAPIGHATQNIAPAAHVHSHNLSTNLSGILDYTYAPIPTPDDRHEPEQFMGYRRAGGGVGVRNEIWIIPTVGCVNAAATAIASRAMAEKPDGVDGIYAFPHPYGCSQLGDDHANTKKILRGMIEHPNAAAVLVLGLGCENNTVAGMQELLGDWDERRVRFLVCQQVDDEIETGAAIVRALAEYAATAIREPVPMSELVVGLKCGGSDGLSGITANPLVGRFSDTLTAMGGTVLLTEVPEMFGAEQILMNRCGNRGLFDDTVSLINNFKGYFMRYDQEIYENPSPGNKDGGITTLEEKSLGCTQKAGAAAVAGVIGYGERPTNKGLVLVQGPGNDIVAATALAAAGAHIILFTTGRGTPLGAPVPVVKLATNTALATRKKHWIDFDAGTLVAGERMDDAAQRLSALVRAVASGEQQAKSEQNGCRDFAIFKDGVTL